jgi:hypothetical protein
MKPDKEHKLLRIKISIATETKSIPHFLCVAVAWR